MSFASSIALLYRMMNTLKPESPVFGWWLASCIVVLFFYGLMFLGLIVKSMKRTPPKVVNSFMSGFDEYREACFFIYCQNLLKRRENKHKRALRLGLQKGVLDFEEIKRLEKAIRKDYDKKFGLLYQLKALLCDAFTSHPDSEAVFMPVRLMAAFSVAAFAQVLSAMVWCKGTIDNRDTVLHLVEVYIKPAKEAIGVISADVEGATGEPYPVNNVMFQLSFVEEHGTSFGSAVMIAGFGGAIIAVFFFFIVYFVMLLDFRSTVLKMRSGQLPFPVAFVRFKHSWTFVGGSISNSLLSFALNVIVFGLILLLLSWSLFYWGLGVVWMIFGNVILGFMVSYVGNMTLNYLVGFWMGPAKNIRLRYWWMNWDVVQLFLAVFSGTLTAIIRILMAVGIMLVAALRIDKSIYPMWVDEIYTLDTLAKGYRATCLIYHYHNNPIVNTFCSVILKDYAARKAGAEGMLPLSSKKRRVYNKFHKMLFMTKNPAIAAFKADKRQDRPYDDDEGKGEIQDKNSGKEAGKAARMQPPSPMDSPRISNPPSPSIDSHAASTAGKGGVGAAESVPVLEKIESELSEGAPLPPQPQYPKISVDNP